MKGYKAFKKGLVCLGKQYAENTVFEEDEAVICKKGMHFCKEPLCVLDYYPAVDENGELTEFAEVEALDDPITDDGKKFCTKRLKIGAKIDLPHLVQASVSCDYEKETPIKTTKENNAKIGSSGDWAKIGSSGDWAKIGSSGDGAQIGSSGYGAKIGSSGYGAQIDSSGDWAQIGSSGYGAKIDSSGYGAQIGSSGDGAQIGSSGYGAQIGSSGYGAQIDSSGNGAKIGSSGKNAVIMCAGNNSIAKGKIGSWITLSEWEDVYGVYTPVCVKTERIDGERIKEDTFYTLKDGKFFEVK